MRERKSVITFEPLRRMAIVFGLVGGLLFVRVWWPIQAERNLGKLQRVESKVFQKKSELNLLKDRYANLTSLTVIDAWAKKNGPWVPPNGENVIAIK
ncbi:MAG: hypothetical protein KCHDKBKB_00195 [Elusimicrobia bacterium]|nr:hypothetical protein [Elusimicrobiota bacterium]